MRNKVLLLTTILLILLSQILLADAYSGGNGSEADPYQIATSEDLLALSNTSLDWSSHFIQTANITFNADSSSVDWDGDGDAVWDTEDQAGFSPIGNSTIKFLGFYNGQDHNIENLYINLPTSDNIALFGYCSLAGISNLTLENVSIKGNNLVGSLLGYSDRLEVENCHASGKVIGVSEKTGGLIGFARITHVSNCHSSVNVYGGDDYTGGLIAHTETACDIRNCYSTGAVTNTGYGHSNGGLIGDNATSTVEYCYTTSDVDAYSTYTAGFAGRNAGGTINNCYCTGNVTAISSSAYVGGFTAYNYSSGEILKCYSASYVDASIHSSYVGGFIGNNAGTVSYCFWDTDSSGKALGIGAGTNLGVTGKTSPEMRTESTFTNGGWDFQGESANGTDEIWTIDAGSNDAYPYLANTPLSDTPSPITLVSFSAKQSDGSITLSWTTASETNNARFLIYRNDEVIGSVDGAGTSSEPHNYCFIDNAVIPSVSYSYILADVDYANGINKYDAEAVSITLSNDLIEADYVIGAAYPNPFNPTAVLPLELTGNAMVKASLYDLNGREIKSIVNATLTAGTHELYIDGSNMTTGIYMIKILMNDIRKVQKIALIK